MSTRYRRPSQALSSSPAWACSSQNSEHAAACQSCLAATSQALSPSPVRGQWIAAGPACAGHLSPARHAANVRTDRSHGLRMVQAMAGEGRYPTKSPPSAAETSQPFRGLCSPRDPCRKLTGNSHLSFIPAKSPQPPQDPDTPWRPLAPRQASAFGAVEWWGGDDSPRVPRPIGVPRATLLRSVITCHAAHGNDIQRFRLTNQWQHENSNASLASVLP